MDATPHQTQASPKRTPPRSASASSARRDHADGAGAPGARRPRGGPRRGRGAAAAARRRLRDQAPRRARAIPSYAAMLAAKDIDGDLQPAAQRAALRVDHPRPRGRQARPLREADRLQRRRGRAHGRGGDAHGHGPGRGLPLALPPARDAHEADRRERRARPPARHRDQLLRAAADARRHPLRLRARRRRDHGRRLLRDPHAAPPRRGRARGAARARAPQVARRRPLHGGGDALPRRRDRTDELLAALRRAAQA